MRYVVVATLRRGVLGVPELLDEANCWRVAEAHAMDDAPRWRGVNWGWERDAQVTDREAEALRRPVPSDLEWMEQAARVQRLMRLAMGRR